MPRLAGKVNSILFLSFFLFLLPVSCSNDILYDQYQTIESAVWENDEAYYFSFTVEDNTIPYDLTLGIRNNNFYLYQNLWILRSEEYPDASFQRDTAEYVLADEFGKWRGNGVSLFQSSFSIRERFYFPQNGQYTFGFRQGMHTDSLKGIAEIGLQIRRSER